LEHAGVELVVLILTPTLEIIQTGVILVGLIGIGLDLEIVRIEGVGAEGELSFPLHLLSILHWGD
jgi:hypothetical protein